MESLRPHVVHLSGHGSRSALLLEDKLGFEREVELDEFMGILGKRPDATRLVVPATCSPRPSPVLPPPSLRSLGWLWSAAPKSCILCPSNLADRAAQWENEVAMGCASHAGEWKSVRWLDEPSR